VRLVRGDKLLVRDPVDDGSCAIGCVQLLAQACFLHVPAKKARSRVKRPAAKSGGAGASQSAAEEVGRGIVDRLMTRRVEAERFRLGAFERKATDLIEGAEPYFIIASGDQVRNCSMKSYSLVCLFVYFVGWLVVCLVG
jgi:hypothetical protein